MIDGNHYYVCVCVNGTQFLTDIYATSLSVAEHYFLDESVCGRTEYGVESCLAFDRESIKTDTFVTCALNSKAVSIDLLLYIIRDRNEEIVKKDKAREEKEKLEKEMKRINSRIKELSEILVS